LENYATPNKGKIKLNLNKIRKLIRITDKLGRSNDAVYKFTKNLCRNLYDYTDNPLYIWEAYVRSRKQKREIPVWVFKYFDAVADSLFKLDEHEKPTSKIHEVLSLNKKCFTSYKTFDSLCEMYFYIQEENNKRILPEIYPDAAKKFKFNLGDEGIKKVYYYIKNLLKFLEKKN
jgi:hypothetical protein